MISRKKKPHALFVRLITTDASILVWLFLTLIAGVAIGIADSHQLQHTWYSIRPEIRSINH
jgi:hypothetical protein